MSLGETQLAAGRWAAVLDGESGPLRELAQSYWYCVYAWWRRAGLRPAEAEAATLGGFASWLGEAPPQRDDPGGERMREWLPAQLAAMASAPPSMPAEAPLEVDLAWAEQRYAAEPEGEPEAIFQRRWALTVLEFAIAAVRDEYEARGEAPLFEETLRFAGFAQTGEEVYAEAAARVGKTSGAMRKAVFEFRARQREWIRAWAADTVADPAQVDDEMTGLLIACEAAGPAASAPLPSTLRPVQPEEVFARAMNSARISTAGGLGWVPPAVEEVAALFPQYELLTMLGHGGMGAVYQARQTSLDRFVAIKLLPLEVSVDEDFADRFRREARAMAMLNHPGIIAVYDFGQTSEGHLFFAMEFVDGASLHDRIHRSPGSLPPAEALGLIEQVCQALAFAHEQGVVHRDIKPANVMVDRHGRVKVADFGLARLTDAANSEQWSKTMTGVVMGTPDYMAPEQKRGQHVDHRADIYALGVMLYEALCGETPQGAFALPSRHGGLDRRLDAIVTKALASKPEERFQSTIEMKAAIATVRPAVARAQMRKLDPTLPPRMESVAPRPPPAPARQGGSGFLVIGVVLATAAGIGYVLRLPAPQPPSRVAPAATAVAAASSPVPLITPRPAGTPVPSLAADKQIPYAVQMFEGHRYLILRDPLPWSQARDRAAALGGHLATLTSKEEVAWFQETYGSRMTDGGAFWLGGSCEEKGQPWRWITGEPWNESVAQWHAGEPIAAGAGGDPSVLEYVVLAGRPGWRANLAGNKTMYSFLEWDEDRPVKAGAAPATPAPATGKPFENTLGLRFVPLPVKGGPTGGQTILFATTETRVQDYGAFVRETQREWPQPAFVQEPAHPAVNVSFDDAVAFCAWLTQRERKLARLGPGARYRLPHDHEWSCAIGIAERENPAEPVAVKRTRYTGIYPWGTTWPPPARAGNFGDETTHAAKSTAGFIPGYTDGFAFTAPVGTFTPNSLGIYDLLGNVTEWCDDPSAPGENDRVLRGQSWKNSRPDSFSSAYRGWSVLPARRDDCGFRIVLATEPPAR